MRLPPGAPSTPVTVTCMVPAAGREGRHGRKALQPSGHAQYAGASGVGGGACLAICTSAMQAQPACLPDATIFNPVQCAGGAWHLRLPSPVCKHAHMCVHVHALAAYDAPPLLTPPTLAQSKAPVSAAAAAPCLAPATAAHTRAALTCCTVCNQASAARTPLLPMRADPRRSLTF